ncbi:MAG: menaquinone biosynthesis decarboxylase [Candidatus Hydrogenedentota bacterium]|nr:MAG: menaquinone biosynthesis decarboxylase [Candidatus Hydrogenedentota bacterium]
MAYRNLNDWIARLEEEGELRRISAPCDVHLEISALTDIVSKAQGPALLFENPSGTQSRMPVLINQFGSRRRMELALETESLDALAEEMEALLETRPPRGILEGIKLLPQFRRLTGIAPRAAKTAPCQEVVKTGTDIRLSELPVITAWPKDAGPFISLGCVFTKDPKSKKRNVGLYRLQVFDETSTGMHWHRHHGGAEHADALPRGKRLPVAVAIGTDPATTFSAVAPLPPGMDELLFAGFLRKAPVPLVPCRTVPLEVPAEAEIVLEGWVNPEDLRTEGPYGDHTGFYSLPDQYPVFRLTAITHRRDPIYATTIVGPPPMEDCWMGYAVERLFLPMLKKMIPEIVDYHMPFEGVFHNLVLVSIRKRYPGQARKVMHALWGLGQMAFAKTIIVFDEDVDVQNPSEAAWVALANIDPERDLEFSFGPAETLDHASRLPWYSSKVGVDATRKRPDEGFARPWPDRQVMDPDVRQRILKRWEEWNLPFPPPVR